MGGPDPQASLRAQRMRRGRPVALLLAVALACSPTERPDVTSVEVWAHAGQAAERSTLEDQVRRFNDANDSIQIEVTFLPEGSYHAQAEASAVAGRVPDLMDVDGPYVALFAWQGHLRPLRGVVPDSLLEAVLPSIARQGSWRGNRYALGVFDSGLGLYASREALRTAGVRIPTSAEDAWSVPELEDALRRLRRYDEDGAVLDLKLNYEGEWFAYAFLPALESAGGGLVDRVAGTPVAQGTLNGPESERVLRELQRWIGEGYVDPDLDDAAFVDGRVAISWSGHWDFPRYRDALGDDLVILPLPDFGDGTRTGQGSWMWAIPSAASHPAAAAAFLAFLMRSQEILRMTDANGAVPGTLEAASRSPLYGSAGPLSLLRTQLETDVAVPRPRTPVYPFASSVFQDVFEAVRTGEPIRPALDAAASAIDHEVQDNRAYPTDE